MKSLFATIPFASYLGVGIYALHAGYVGTAVILFIAAFFTVNLIVNTL